MQFNINIKTKAGKAVKFKAFPTSLNEVTLIIDENDLISNSKEEETNNLGLNPVNIAYNKENNQGIQYEEGPAISFFSSTLKHFKNKEVKELYTKYLEELKILESNPKGCSSCQKGALMRKYKALILPYYKDKR